MNSGLPCVVVGQLPGGVVLAEPSWVAPYGTARVSDPLATGSSRWMTVEIQVASDSGLIGHSFTLGTENFTSANGEFYDNANANADGDPITVQVIAP